VRNRFFHSSSLLLFASRPSSFPPVATRRWPPLMLMSQGAPISQLNVMIESAQFRTGQPFCHT